MSIHDRVAGALEELTKSETFPCLVSIERKEEDYWLVQYRRMDLPQCRPSEHHFYRMAVRVIECTRGWQLFVGVPGVFASGSSEEDDSRMFALTLRSLAAPWMLKAYLTEEGKLSLSCETSHPSDCTDDHVRFAVHEALHKAISGHLDWVVKMWLYEVARPLIRAGLLDQVDELVRKRLELAERMAGPDPLGDRISTI